MSIYNAIASLGSNTGAGVLAGARNAYAVRQDKLARGDQQRRENQAQANTDRAFSRNVLVQDRQQDRALTQQADKHFQDTLAMMQNAEDPKSVYELRRSQAVKLGLPGAESAPPYEQVAGMVADPMARAEEMGQMQNRLAIERAEALAPIETQAVVERARAVAPVEAAAARAAGKETPEQARARDMEAAVETARRKAEIVPATVKAKAQDKLKSIRAIRAQLNKVQKAFDNIKDSFSAGPLQGFAPSPSGKKFDAAVAALRPFVRQLTRTPGEGHMSDYESRMAEAVNPDRTQYESVTQQQIDDLFDIAAALESGYGEFSKADREVVDEKDDPLGLGL